MINLFFFPHRPEIPSGGSKVESISGGWPHRASVGPIEECSDDMNGEDRDTTRHVGGGGRGCDVVNVLGGK